MNHTARIIPKRRIGLPLLGILFFSFYFLGYLFPDFWWTTHFLAFVPNSSALPILLLAALGFLYPWVKKESLLPATQLQKLSDTHGKLFILLLSLLAACAMYFLGIYVDYFGDAYKVIPHVDEKITSIPAGTDEALFKFSLSPWEGHNSILALITYIAFYLEISYKEAFQLLDVCCGFLFVLSWLSFTRYYLKTGIARLLMGMSIISAPFLLIFFGHIETYAPVFLSFSLWLMGILIYLQKRDTRILWGLIPGLLVCLKFHPVALLFIPALFICLVQQYGSSFLKKSLSSWKGIIRWILLPIFSSGAVLYFFVFKDHIDERSLNTKAMAFDRLFLPLFSPEAPLDKYNLLSFNHIFDYVAEIFLWSPILLFLILLLIISQRKKLNWEKAEIRIIGLSLLLFASLFFMINPLLSMQMDWDLMAIPAPVFLAMGMVLIKEFEDSEILTQAIGPAIALFLLCLPNFYLHQQKEALSERYISLGIRIYHSYYEWSSTNIQRGLYLQEFPSRNLYEKRKKEILQKLKPYAIPFKDFEYARLYNEEGKYYSRVAKDYDKALQYLLIAEEFFPQEKNGLLYRMETFFLKKEYQKAFRYSEALIQQQYPSEKKSLAIGVQCALEAGFKQEALHITNFYLSKWKDNQTLWDVNQGIRKGVPIDRLKQLFAQAP